MLLKGGKEMRSDRNSKGQFIKGCVSYNKGKKYSIEKRKRMGQITRDWLLYNAHPRKGKKHTEEAKQKMSEARKNWCKKNPNKILKGKNHPFFGKEAPNKGKAWSLDQKRKMSEIKRAYYRKHPEMIKRGENHPRYGSKFNLSIKAKNKISKALKGKRKSLQHKKSILKTSFKKGNVPWNKGRQIKPKTKILLSSISKELWQDPKYIKKALKGTEKRPSSIEQLFENLMPNGIRYVGNRTWWRRLPNGKYKNPDFKVTGQDKVIEIFGDYWHRNDNPDELIKLYKKANLDCLIFWEKEIRENPILVFNKVNNFLKGGNDGII